MEGGLGREASFGSLSCDRPSRGVARGITRQPVEDHASPPPPPPRAERFLAQKTSTLAAWSGVRSVSGGSPCPAMIPHRREERAWLSNPRKGTASRPSAPPALSILGAGVRFRAALMFSLLSVRSRYRCAHARLGTTTAWPKRQRPRFRNRPQERAPSIVDRTPFMGPPVVRVGGCWSVAG